MKESEAKTKICPFVQNMAAVISTVEIRNEGALAKAIDLGAAANIHCICGDCMAWVETDPEVEKIDVTDFNISQLDILLKDGWHDDSKDEYYRRRVEPMGYCSRLNEPEEEIVGVKKGALDLTNMVRLRSGKIFEFNGPKEDFIIIKKVRHE